MDPLSITAVSNFNIKINRQRKTQFSIATGGRSADEIVTWLIKKTGPPALNLAAVEEAKLFIESNNVAVVGFFKDQTSDDAKKFLNVAATTDDQQFAITSEDSVFGEYEAQDGNVILFKKVRSTYYKILIFYGPNRSYVCDVFPNICSQCEADSINLFWSLINSFFMLSQYYPNRIH